MLIPELEHLTESAHSGLQACGGVETPDAWQLLPNG